MRDEIITLILAPFVAAFVVYALYAAICTPVVQISHSTGECMQVIGDGSCDSLPEKYIKEWVK